MKKIDYYSVLVNSKKQVDVLMFGHEGDDKPVVVDVKDLDRFILELRKAGKK
jgi:hypothetical protein